MARRRMIDPNIWESEDFGDLTFRQRLLHIAMFSGADDEGRGIASIKRLRALAFAYDELSLADVAEDLAAISDCISVDVYEVDGKLFYAYRNWKTWQSVEKPKASTIPTPEDGVIIDSAAIRDAYPMNRGCVGDESGNDRGSLPDQSGLKESKGKEEKGRERARARATTAPSPKQPPATEAEQAVIVALRSVKNYPADDEKDLTLIRSLAADFPEIDLRKSAQNWAAYKLDHPLEDKSSPRHQVRQWVNHDREFAEQRNGAVPAKTAESDADLPTMDQLQAMIRASHQPEASHGASG